MCVQPQPLRTCSYMYFEAIITFLFPLIMVTAAMAQSSMHPASDWASSEQPLDIYKVPGTSVRTSVIVRATDINTDPRSCIATDPDMALSGDMDWDFTMATDGRHATHNRPLLSFLESPVPSLFITLKLLFPCLLHNFSL